MSLKLVIFALVAVSFFKSLNAVNEDCSQAVLQLAKIDAVLSTYDTKNAERTISFFRLKNPNFDDEFVNIVKCEKHLKGIYLSKFEIFCLSERIRKVWGNATENSCRVLRFSITDLYQEVAEAFACYTIGSLETTEYSLAEKVARDLANEYSFVTDPRYNSKYPAKVMTDTANELQICETPFRTAMQKLKTFVEDFVNYAASVDTV